MDISSICPPEPEDGENMASDEPDFVSHCQAEVVAMADGPVVWTDQLLTHSQKWGLIWRADYWEHNQENEDDPTRVVCFRRSDGVFGMTISGCQHGKLSLKP
jgi:hypothetical protein